MRQSAAAGLQQSGRAALPRVLRGGSLLPPLAKLRWQGAVVKMTRQQGTAAKIFTRRCRRSTLILFYGSARARTLHALPARSQQVVTPDDSYDGLAVFGTGIGTSVVVRRVDVWTLAGIWPS